MWVRLSKYEECQLLRKHNGNLYTIPNPLEIEYNPDVNVTYYFRGTKTPFLYLKKGWNDRGLWETSWWKWEA